MPRRVLHFGKKSDDGPGNVLWEVRHACEVVMAEGHFQAQVQVLVSVGADMELVPFDWVAHRAPLWKPPRHLQSQTCCLTCFERQNSFFFFFTITFRYGVKVKPGDNRF